VLAGKDGTAISDAAIELNMVVDRLSKDSVVDDE
jgi:hypothetical protein